MLHPDGIRKKSGQFVSNDKGDRMSASIHNLIKTEYDKRQKAAYDSLEEKKSEVYAKFPRIQDIDEEIKLNGIHYNKMILKGMISTEDASTRLLGRIDELRAEKLALLMEGGYPVNYLEISYQCSHCRDTGYIEGTSGAEKCVCYKQQLISHLYSESNLKLVENENFSTFNETFYPDAVNEAKYGIKISPRQNILSIRERCTRFIENFANSEEKNLFLSGPTGVGKTFLSNCIAMELINGGRTVLYQTAPTLFNIVNEHKMKAFTEEGYMDTRYRNILEVELLIIDDLGTEPPSASRFAEFLTILNTRQLNNLTRPCKTIISTNIEARQLYEYYSERVASRIIGGFDMFRLAGEDIRRLKKVKESTK